ncbi:MAG: hydantoinase/oxoprolinase family protein [Methyloceanibacter sp.]
MTRVIGWDLGGANVKLAWVEAAKVERVVQIPCALVANRGKFDLAMEAALPLLPAAALHAVTMTGELSDVFSHRQEGVAYLVDLMRKVAAGPLLIYAGSAGFLAPEEAKQRVLEVASANWHATAALAARHSAAALLLDFGTTTTDLIPIARGAVAARGATDAERLTEGELVYTGVVRTPVMAVTQQVPFRGRVQGIAAERFATMADVWRLVGDLPGDADPYPAADQRGKSMDESAARLARMLGRDASDADPNDWIALACYFASCQLSQIEAAARALVAREQLVQTAPVIGAGCGRFVAKQLAARLGHPYLDFGEIVDAAPEARELAARCAPAVAVALLAESPGTAGFQPIGGRDA